MMTALARIVEPTSGSIILDDIDVSTIGLADLRKSLAIIPQDPVSFFFLCVRSHTYSVSQLLCASSLRLDLANAMFIDLSF